MTTYGYIMPKSGLIARSALRAGNLSRRAKTRLKIMDWHQKHGQNVSLTSRRFGLERLTVRRWVKRLKALGPAALNDRSHRPKHLRQPTTPWSAIMAVVTLRKQYPAWSKHKLHPLLKTQGINVSVSTVGRILKRGGLIHHKSSAKRKRAALHPRARFPRGLKISRPGDLVQIDTKHIMLPGGRRHFQFTAIDVLSKQRVLEVYPSESSRNGANFLKICLQEFPFKVHSVQTDNGAPFLKEFEKLCRRKRLPHYYIYPRTPKQNSYVEASHGADKREFYQQGNIYQNRETMAKKLKHWQKIWNEVRPHEALNYLAPKDYLNKWLTGRLPTRDIITLQT